jgi:glyoxylase-like metal-dependent hydrolase (beta-lactamase superfamily II)
MPEIEIIRHPYLGIYVNCFRIRTEQGDIFIDTGLANHAAGLETGRMKNALILSTHGHWDHIGSHRRAQKQGTRVFAHAGDERYYSDFDWHWDVLFGQFKNDFDLPPERKTAFWEGIGQPLKPDRWLEDGEELAIGGCRIIAVHTPGHSSGSVCYLLPDDGVLFTGDTLMGNGFFAGIPQYTDAAAYRASMERLANLQVETVYCDHSEAMPGKMLAERAKTGIACMERIRKRVAAFTACYRGEENGLLKEAMRDVCRFEGKNPGGGACVTVLTHLRELAPESQKAASCVKRRITP